MTQIVRVPLSKPIGVYAANLRSVDISVDGGELQILSSGVYYERFGKNGFSGNGSSDGSHKVYLLRNGGENHSVFAFCNLDVNYDGLLVRSVGYKGDEWRRSPNQNKHVLISGIEGIARQVEIGFVGFVPEKVRGWECDPAYLPEGFKWWNNLTALENSGYREDKHSKLWVKSIPLETSVQSSPPSPASPQA